MLSKECFTKGVKTFIIVFRIKDITEETIDVWYDLLKKYNTDEQFADAIEDLCENLKDFYPSNNFVALVREKISELYPRDGIKNAYEIPGLMDRPEPEDDSC